MQLSTGNRLRSFDILKLFAIFLVLWGHCIQYFLSSEPVDEPLYRTIYAFHMPLFMMISGYFAASSMHIRLNDFLKKKSVQLLLPCLTWGILISFLIRPALDSSFIDSLLHSFRGGFWFLKSCFICYLIAFLEDSIPKFFEICSSWGQYTLGIYILQSYIIEVLLARYLNFDHLNFYLFNFLVAPSISIIILIVCVFVIKAIHKSPVCAFWLLGKFPRRTNHCPNK